MTVSVRIISYRFMERSEEGSLVDPNSKASPRQLELYVWDLRARAEGKAREGSVQPLTFPLAS